MGLSVVLRLWLGFCDRCLTRVIFINLLKSSFFENDYARYGLLGHLQIFKNSSEVNRFCVWSRFKLSIRLSQCLYEWTNFLFLRQKVPKAFWKCQFKQLQDKLFDDIDISHFSFREYGENEPKRYYFGQRKWFGIDKFNRWWYSG